MKTMRTNPVLLFFIFAGITSLVGIVLAGECLAPKPLQKMSRQATILASTKSYINRQNTEKYPLAAKVDNQNWFQLDLKPYCNINLLGGKGKTCPVKLPCLPCGKQTYYGVPFYLIAPEENRNKTALAMPSKRMLTFDLPDKVIIPVNRKAKVFYILLASYYTLKGGEQYLQFIYDDKSMVRLPIVGTVDTGDWYHPHTRINQGHTRCVLVPQTKGDATKFRNLHIIEWPNPHPGKKVAEITVKTDRKAPMALIIAGITGAE